MAKQTDISKICKSVLLGIGLAMALDVASTEKGFTQSESKELRALKEYYHDEDYEPSELIRLANRVTRKDELCEAMWRRGEGYYGLEQYNNAEKDYEMSIKEGCSNDSYTWYSLGVTLDHQNKDRQAWSAYSTAIHLNRSDDLLDNESLVVVHNNRGLLYQDRGEISSACSDFKLSADMGDDDAQIMVKELCGSKSNIASSGKSSKHDKCINAADYKGCMDHQMSTPAEKGVSPGTVNVATPSEYNYLPKTVKQLKIRGSYGRYIQFIGKTNNAYDGTAGSYSPGSSGREVCSTSSGMSPTLTLNQGSGRRHSYSYAQSTYTNCRTEGYVAPRYSPGTSGGIQARSFQYQLDCKDMTFDRKGDLRDGSGWRKGWMNVSADPTAQAVANKYCGSISSLPKYND